MSLLFDAASAALVLIDLQIGILNAPLAPHRSADIVKRATELAPRLRESGGIVVAVHVGFSEGNEDRLRQPVDNPAPASATIPANWSDLVAEIAALSPEVVIKKRQWGAFYGTELDLQLRRRGVRTVVLGGVSTNFGVESTAREAWQHGYAVIVAEDMCASQAADAHSFAIKSIFPRIARVRSTDAILSALSDI